MNLPRIINGVFTPLRAVVFAILALAMLFALAAPAFAAEGDKAIVYLAAAKKKVMYFNQAVQFNKRVTMTKKTVMKHRLRVNERVFLKDELIVRKKGFFQKRLRVNGQANFKGKVLLGDGGDLITINSSVWDISSDGAISGVKSVASASGSTLSLNGASGVKVNGNASTIELTTTGDLDVNSGDYTWTGDSAILKSDGIYKVDATGVVVVDSDASTTIGGAGVNVTSDGGALKLKGDGSADIDIVNTGATIDVDAATVDVNATTTDVSGKVDLSGTGGSTGAADFDVAGYSQFAGDVEVDGAANLDSTLDVAGTTMLGAAGGAADTTVRGDLTVDENLAVTGTQTTTGLTTLNGGVTADGGVFTVADATGALHTANTFNADGTVTLGTAGGSADTTVEGDLTVDENVAVTGWMTVTDQANLDGGLDVNGLFGVATNGDTEINGNFIADSVVTLGTGGGFGDTAVLGDLNVSENLDVTGTSSLTGALTLAGLASLDGGIDVDGAFTVAGDGSGDTVTTGTLSAANTTILGTFDSSGLASLDGGIDLDGVFSVADVTGAVTTSGAVSTTSTFNADGAVTLGTVGGVADTTVEGDLAVGENLTVTGTTTQNDVVTVGSDGIGHDVTFNSDVAGDNMVWDDGTAKLTVTGTDSSTALAVADGNVDVTDDLNVDGTVTLGTVGGAADTTVEGDLAVGENLAVTGTTSMNDDLTFTENNAAGRAIDVAQADGADAGDNLSLVAGAAAAGSGTDGGNLNLSGGAGDSGGAEGAVVANSTLQADSDGGQALGAAGTRWSSLFVNTVNFDTAITDADTGNTAVTFGDSTTLDSFTVMADTAITDGEWSVSAAGAASFGSTLNADGTVTLGTVGGAADTTVEGDLTVDEDALVTGGLTNTGLATFNGGVTADAGVFTIADTTGAVHTASDLNADGTVTLGTVTTGDTTAEGDLTVGEDFYATGMVYPNGGINADSGAFTVADGTGDVVTTGTLNVTGASTLAGAFVQDTLRLAATALTTDAVADTWDPTDSYLEITFNAIDDNIAITNVGANEGDLLYIVNVGANQGKLDTDGANMMTAGGLDQTMTQYDTVQMIFDGTNWLQVGAVIDNS